MSETELQDLEQISTNQIELDNQFLQMEVLEHIPTEEEDGFARRRPPRSPKEHLYPPNLNMS